MNEARGTQFCRGSCGGARLGRRIRHLEHVPEHCQDLTPTISMHLAVQKRGYESCVTAEDTESLDS